METEEIKTVQIMITHLRPSKTNPRQHFDEAKLKDLAASIKEKGILEPLLVREMKSPHPTVPVRPGAEDHRGYEIVAGERRYRAAKLAGLTMVLAIKRILTDAQVVEIQVVENMQRDDLTPMEEAAGYKMLHEKHNMDFDELAVKIGKSKSYIYKRLKLLDLAAEVRDAVLAGALPVSWAQEMLRVPRRVDQLEILKDCVGDDFHEIQTLGELRQWIETDFLLELKRAPFSLAETSLVPKATSCSVCPKRTGAQADLLDDASKKDCCLDAVCHQAKLEEHGKRVVAELEAKGKKPVKGPAAVKFLKNAAHGDWEDLDHNANALRGTKTWRKAAGKDALEKLATVVVVNDKGVVQEFAKKDAVKKAVPKSALEDWAKGSAGSSGESNYDKNLRSWKNKRARAVTEVAELALATYIYGRSKLVDALRHTVTELGMLEDRMDIVGKLLKLAPVKCKPQRWNGNKTEDYDKAVEAFTKSANEKGLGNALRAMHAADLSNDRRIPTEYRPRYSKEAKRAGKAWAKVNPAPKKPAKKKPSKTKTKKKKKAKKGEPGYRDVTAKGGKV